MSLRPEERALLFAVPITKLAPPPPLDELDWGSLVALATRHKLAPLLLRGLPELEARAGEAPQSARKELQRSRWGTMAHWILLSSTLERLLAELETAGLGALLLKGSLFASSLYDQAGMRAMCDLDLLVRERDYPRLEEILARLGFRSSTRELGLAPRSEAFERHYVGGDPGAPISLELHHGLGHASRYRIDYEGVWARSVSAGSLGAREFAAARCMSAEDNVLHHSVHMANDLFADTDLRRLVDFHEMVCQWSPDWGVLVRRAKAWGVTTALYLTSTTARRLLRTPVPEDVVEELAPSAVRRGYLARFLDLEGLGLYRYPRHSPATKRLLLGFALMDRLSDRLHFGSRYAGLRLRDALAGLGNSRPSSDNLPRNGA